MGSGTDNDLSLCAPYTMLQARYVTFIAGPQYLRPMEALQREHVLREHLAPAVATHRPRHHACMYHFQEFPQGQD